MIVSKNDNFNYVSHWLPRYEFVKKEIKGNECIYFYKLAAYCIAEKEAENKRMAVRNLMKSLKNYFSKKKGIEQKRIYKIQKEIERKRKATAKNLRNRARNIFRKNKIKNDCCVCIDNKLCNKFFNCEHINLCGNCYGCLKVKTCPLCRSE